MVNSLQSNINFGPQFAYSLNFIRSNYILNLKYPWTFTVVFSCSNLPWARSTWDVPFFVSEKRCSWTIVRGRLNKSNLVLSLYFPGLWYMSIKINLRTIILTRCCNCKHVFPSPFLDTLFHTRPLSRYLLDKKGVGDFCLMLI